jgi:hypothetical protein
MPENRASGLRIIHKKVAAEPGNSLTNKGTKKKRERFEAQSMIVDEVQPL